MDRHGETITIQTTAARENVSLKLSWSSFPDGTQFIVLMTDDNVTSIPIKHHGSNLSHWEVNDILPMLFGCSENLLHAKNTSLYFEEKRKSLNFYQGINS